MAIAKVQSTSVSAFVGDSVTVVGGTTTGYQLSITPTAGSLLVADVAVYNQSTAGHLLTAITDSRGQTWTRRNFKLNSTTAGDTYLYTYDCVNAAAGATTVSLDFAQEDDSNYVGWMITEYSGLATASPADITADAEVGPTAASITVTGSTLAQADELVHISVAGKWWWNFNTSNTAPSTYTLNGQNNSNLYCPMQSAYKIVSSTTAPSATWTVPADQSIADGGAALLTTYKMASTSLRVKGLFETAINSDSSITAYVWRGEPTTNYATKYTAQTAEASGGILYLTPAPSGAAAGDTVNIIAYNSADGSDFGTGIVESY
jgi:hypothetical protein